MLTTEQLIDCAIDPMHAITALVRDDVKIVELRAALDEFARVVEQAAYLEAAALCDRFADRQMHPAECASAIRAMAKG